MICHYFQEPSFLIYVPDLPGLIYYAHIPAAVIALLVGIVVLASDRKALLNQLLFGISISFFIWTVSTLILWTNIHSDIMLFTWSFLAPAAAFLSIFSIYFAYVFLTKKDVSLTVKGIFIALLAPLIILAPSSYAIGGFNLVNCDAFGFEGFTNTFYFPALGVVAMIWILGLLVRQYRKTPAGSRTQLVLMGTGIELFLFSFFTTIFLGQYLTTNGFLPDSQLETYGYFGMIVFVVYIAILMVRFSAFHVGLIASQALIIGLLILIGSQFAYVRTTTNLALNGIAFVLTAAIGFILIRSVKREIKQRHQIEALAKDLEKANKQQIILLHFITHQIKGFVTKSRNIFATMLEGDLGKLPDEAKPFVEEGLRSDTKGVETIQEILNAANIQSGKVNYVVTPINLRELTESIVKDLKPAADAKGLTFRLVASEGDFTVEGDQLQLTNAIKNLIDNSIKYTLEGSVTVCLVREKKTLRLVVKDTGVGITPEDREVLFTEGGHGKESQKVNVESTGFGLYIVRNIVEAHHGKVWAESDGANKGSKFIVELPMGEK